METKECRKCNNTFSIAEFPKYKEGKYTSHVCRACRNAYTYEWARCNQDSRLESQRKYRESDYRKSMLSRVKYRAKKENIPFNLSIDDIPFLKICPVFNVPFTFGKKGVPKHWSPSLDKIIPMLGYVKGNVQVISYLANCMKQDATPEQLNQFAEWVKNGQNCS